MKAITYKITATLIPGYSKNYHVGNSLGYAYETDTHFVHFFGKSDRWYVISHGLTVTEKKDTTLNDWVVKTFAAVDIREMLFEPGSVNQLVWRPGLYFLDDTFKSFNLTSPQMRLAAQALKLLIDRLDDLFIYIEPNKDSLNTYSHKSRELLILACAEVENYWNQYLLMAGVKAANGKNYTTKDYVKLNNKLYLPEYEFTLKAYADIPPIIPFKGWDDKSPTQSLIWYDAYNKTKHDRNTYFSEAKLGHCITAVVANLVLFSTMFSPYSLFDQSDTFSSLANQHFDFRLIDCCPSSFYLPLIETTDLHEKIQLFDSHRRNKPFMTNPFHI
ncbi:hypothetical protein HDF18_17760 [Mucilaginibacter sp. X5P1]|uniref:hypothetical protein n=1 Tax=Mucilaginibacter sp. X5P1 TaxID=2723088 RepID=UPI00161498D9|nr:hypothetical protein [Mucilaginibacter sp. X5P1]MBB6139485.1 hypothetical protein [Mucilaginibacter sp. X5P1]